MDISDAPDTLALLTPAALDRDSPLPLHAQIRRRLMAAIAAWPSPALRFPTEETLSAHFEVSRMTVRKSIDELVQRGYLRRQRRAGTFVAFGKMEEHFTPAMDFLDQWASHGRAIVIRLLSHGMRPAPEAEATALGIAPGSRALTVKRLRLSGTVPVSLDFRVIAPAYAEGVTRRDASSASLLDGLRKVAIVTRATMQIEATAAETATARALDVHPGDPVLFRRMVYRDADGKRIMAGHSFYRADQARYVVDLPIAHLATPKRKPSP